jgi:hypothetical protein
MENWIIWMKMDYLLWLDLIAFDIVLVEWKHIFIDAMEQIITCIAKISLS